MLELLPLKPKISNGFTTDGISISIGTHLLSFQIIPLGKKNPFHILYWKLFGSRFHKKKSLDLSLPI